MYFTLIYMYLLNKNNNLSLFRLLSRQRANTERSMYHLALLALLVALPNAEAGEGTVIGVIISIIVIIIIIISSSSSIINYY